MLTVIDKTNKLNGDKIENLSPNNLKKGITVLGVTGTLDANIPQEKIITPKTEGGVFVPDEGYTNFSKAYVEEVNEKTDPNFKIENIKNGVSILGQEGVLSTVPKNYQDKKININTNGTHDITVDGGYDAIKRLDMVVSVPTGGGAPENTITGDGNITPLDIIEGEKAYAGGAEVVGVLPKKTGKQIIKEPAALATTDTKDGLIIELNLDHKSDTFYAKDSSIGYSMPYEEAKTKFGITADKIMTGNTVLGVEGTATEKDFANLAAESKSIEIKENKTYTVVPEKDHYISDITFNVDVPKSVESYDNVDIIDIISSQKLDDGYVSTLFGGSSRTDEKTQPWILVNIDLKNINPEDMTMSFIYSQNFDGIFNPERYGGYGINFFSEKSHRTRNYCKILFIGPKMFDSQPVKKITDLDNFKFSKDNYFIPFKSDGTSLLDTSEITDMSHMFSPGEHSVSNLKRVPLLNTSKVINMEDTFKNNPELLEVALLDTAQVKNMKSIFSGCKKLKTIPQFILKKVEQMDYAFDGCTELESIPELKTYQLLSAPYMFRDCENLKKVEKITFKKCTNIVGLFQNCKSLQETPSIDAPYALDINSLFEGCENLTSFPYNKICRFNSATNADFIFKNCKGMKNFPLNISIPRVESLNYAFEKCSSLEKVRHTDSAHAAGIEIAKAISLDYTFLDCINLKRCEAHWYNRLESARGTFYNCPLLTYVEDITPEVLIGSKLSDIREMFLGCVSLENLPNISFSSSSVQAERAFENCPKLNNNSLNKILKWGIENDGMRRLSHMGLSAEQIEKCKGLSNWEAFVNAGGTED